MRRRTGRDCALAERRSRIRRQDGGRDAYPGGVSADAAVPKDAPPAFLCAAFDDRGPAGTSLALTQKFRDANINAEIHLYSKGGHGFGMRDRPLPITSWIVRFQEWMRASGFLAAASAVAQ
jgi:acetyl esterase/lipase